MKGSKEKEKEKSGKKEAFVDYYTLLGVTPAATYNQINDAFRDIALIHHPDRKNPDADVELFKMAARAKKTLTNEDSRLTYNRKMIQQSVRFAPKHKDKVPTKRKDQDYHVDLKADLRDVMLGSTKDLVVSTRRVCGSCNGLGSTRGSFYSCNMCHGHGLLCTSFDTDDDGVNTIEASGDCFECGGIGVHRNKTGSKCPDCNGVGVVTFQNKLKVTLLPGFSSIGHIIRIADKGHCRVNGLPGDVIVSVKIISDKYVSKGESFSFGIVPTVRNVDIVIQRASKEQHVLIEQDITLRQALVGFSVCFEHLDGRILELSPLEHGKVTQSGHRRVFRGAGFPYKTSNGTTQWGDLSVVYNVIVPPALDAASVDSIDRCLATVEPSDDLICARFVPGIKRKRADNEGSLDSIDTETTNQEENENLDTETKKRKVVTILETSRCILS